MPIQPGTQIGPYQVTSALGAGGMGMVYRARDSRLGRDVALKILPDAFAHDRDRLTRFEREGKLLASLNHPNLSPATRPLLATRFNELYGQVSPDGHWIAYLSD